MYVNDLRLAGFKLIGKSLERISELDISVILYIIKDKEICLPVIYRVIF